MKIFAVSWVMGSPIDSHVKEMFACNPSLELAGFIFPEVRVPELEGVPIFDYSNAPIDRQALYVDFSMAQRLDPAAQAWCARSGVHVIGLSQFIQDLASIQAGPDIAYKIEALSLAQIRELKVSASSLAAVSMPSLHRLLDVLACYRNLNFRALHEFNDGLTLEGFVLKMLEGFNRYVKGGRIHVHSHGFDGIAIQLSKVSFTIREFAELTIYQEGDTAYHLRGRERSEASSSVHFVSSDRVGRMAGELLGDAHLLIHLRRGLLDFESCLAWINALSHEVKSVAFHQISSRLSDAFLECHLVQKL